MLTFKSIVLKPIRLQPISVSFILLCCGSQWCVGQTPEQPSGRISTVADRMITITLTSKTRPTVGDQARIYVVIPGLDQKADVATATVTKVTTAEIEASIVSATGAVKVGQQVEFLKSTATKTPKPGTIPNLVGLSAEQAKTQLAALNLKATFQVGDPAPSADREFTVAQQRPAAGAPVADSQTITVTLFGRALTAGKKLDLA